MRAVAIAVFLSSVLGAPAAMAGQGQTVFFWENEQTYGWSLSPDRTVSPPIRGIKRLSLTENCARRVGRLLQSDDASLTRSTTLTNSCVQNGGRL